MNVFDNGALKVSSSASVATINGGFGYSDIGELIVEDLGSSAVPAGTPKIGGIAVKADGTVYVTTDSPSSGAFIAGVFVRDDGALHVTSSEPGSTWFNARWGLVGANGAVYASGIAFLPSDLANLEAWYRFNTDIDSTEWLDQSGNDRTLSFTGSPTISSGSVILNGTDEFGRATFTLNQPFTVYLLAKAVTWAQNDRIFDGATGQARLYQNSSSPTVSLYAGGSVVANNSDWTLDTYAVVQVVYNDASSLIQIDGGTATTGDPGAGDPGGFTLGASTSDANHGNIQAKEVVIYTGAHDADTRAQVRAYLNTL